MSETVVTRDWISSAIKKYEQDSAVELVSTEFNSKRERNGDSYFEAKVEAKVGGAVKSYSWIIRSATPAAADKNAYIVSNLGAKIASFVAARKLRKPVTIPFRWVEKLVINSLKV